MRLNYQRLVRFLEWCSAKGNIDPILVEFGKDGVVQRQVDSTMTIAAMNSFARSYFTEYDEVGRVQLPAGSLLGVVKRGFSATDDVEFAVRGDQVILRTQTEEYVEKLPEVDLPDIGKETRITKYGIIPEDFEVKRAYAVNADNLKKLQKADRYKLKYGSFGLAVTVETEFSRYTKSVPVITSDGDGSGELVVDATYLDTAVGQFEGPIPIWITFTQGPIVISQSADEYTVTYIIAPMVE